MPAAPVLSYRTLSVNAHCRAHMKTFLLLVAWFTPSQATTSYQVTFICTLAEKDFMALPHLQQLAYPPLTCMAADL